MHLLTFLGFPAYVDEHLGETHTTIEELKHHYQNKPSTEKPMIPSSGIILKFDGDGYDCTSASHDSHLRV